MVQQTLRPKMIVVVHPITSPSQTQSPKLLYTKWKQPRVRNTGLDNQGSHKEAKQLYNYQSNTGITTQGSSHTGPETSRQWQPSVEMG